MHVKNSLTGGRVAVHDDPVAVLFKSFRFRQFLGDKIKIADLLSIRRCQVVDRRDVFAGNDQDMRWCLWIDVPKGQHLVRFQDDVGVEFAADKFAKQAIRITYLGSHFCSFIRLFGGRKTRATRCHYRRTPAHHRAARRGRYGSPALCNGLPYRQDSGPSRLPRPSDS